ncbi:MAG: PUR family DNA/RNA-binding protein [Chlorobi bacterium]|nr:PUR family DNA/RNA-binding protein [Chlorobiota bacterium]
MSEKDFNDRNEIFSRVLRAGRRTYFFDVRETRAGDYYLTITESKRQNNEDGSFYYRKHKIYLYKEDFGKFKDLLEEVMNYIIDQKGPEVISERHRPDFDPARDLAENKETVESDTPAGQAEEPAAEQGEDAPASGEEPAGESE